MTNKELPSEKKDIENEKTTSCAAKKISVGGQAIIEGVMMRSPNRISIAVRKPSGELDVRGWNFLPFAKRYKLFSLPILRGFTNMIEMLYWGMKTLDISAGIAEGVSDNAGKSSFGMKLWSIVSMFFGLAIGVVLFAFLPLWTSSLLGFSQNPLAYNAIAGSVRMLIFVAYIFGISQLEDVKRLFRYHGAEHKTIHAFEAKTELNAENVRSFTTLHARCGTSFLLIVALAAIFFFAIIDGLLFAIWNFAPKPLLRLPIHLALLPFLAGISYEILKISDKLAPKNALVRFLISPGLWLQKITTAPPDDSMIEAAIAALKDSISQLEEV